MLLTTTDPLPPNSNWLRIDDAGSHWLLPRATCATISQDPTPSGGPAGGSGPAPAGGPTGGSGDTRVPDPNPTGGQGAGGFDNIFLIMGLVVLVMLVMSFRRESKARKQQQAMLSSIKSGDKVVTSSGIHGVVHKLDDRTVTLLLDSAQVTFERSAVARIVRDEQDAVAQKSA